MDRCCNCGGPFHPATGHAFSEKMGACGPCAGRFFAWVVSHTNKKPSKPRNGRPRPAETVSFYEAARTSVKAV